MYIKRPAFGKIWDFCNFLYLLRLLLKIPNYLRLDLIKFIYIYKNHICERDGSECERERDSDALFKNTGETNNSKIREPAIGYILPQRTINQDYNNI